MSEKLKRLLRKLWDYTTWLILGNHCYYCNALVEKDEKLCLNCRENLPIIMGERCKNCGAEKERCACKNRKMKFNGITAPFYYEGGIQECLKLLKFNGMSFMAKRLAKDMAECVRKDFEGVDFDFICYVPFSNIQRMTRDYNQSELLAENLSKMLDIPCENALVKIFNTETQHDTDSKYRKGNVHGIYDVKDNFDIKGKKVLLVDDIMTTGETLSNCAVIMKIRGAEKVYCVTSALTPKRVIGKKKKDE